MASSWYFWHLLALTLVGFHMLNWLVFLGNSTVYTLHLEACLYVLGLCNSLFLVLCLQSWLSYLIQSLNLLLVLDRELIVSDHLLHLTDLVSEGHIIGLVFLRIFIRFLVLFRGVTTLRSMSILVLACSQLGGDEWLNDFLLLVFFLNIFHLVLDGILNQLLVYLLGIIFFAISIFLEFPQLAHCGVDLLLDMALKLLHLRHILAVPHVVFPVIDEVEHELS